MSDAPMMRAEGIATVGIDSLSASMTLLLDAGLQLCLFPAPRRLGGPPWRRTEHAHAAWFQVMEWRKPG
jgi:hypothetical protein